jgi:hypothetical protein
MSGTARLRLALACLALGVLALFHVLDGRLPWLGHFEWITGAQPETGLAWTAPLNDEALDEDGKTLEAELFEWRSGPGSWPCELAGPAFADMLCSRFWHRIGPPHQLHDAIRSEGGGGFSVWHGQLYFSTPDGSAPGDRRFALWVPWIAGAQAASALSGLALFWAIWPVLLGLVRRYRWALLAVLFAAGGLAAIPRGPTIGALAWGGALLAALQFLPAARRRARLVAGLCALAGFVLAETGLSLALPALGLVPKLQATQMLKYLVELETDRPVLLLVGSSYSQYGIDETALQQALEAAGHKVTVARFGFGGLSIPERLYYLRRYLASARHRPAAVLFEISAYYELKPLKQLQQNPFSAREIAALDGDNLRLSLAWVFGPEGAGSDRLTLAAELVGDYLLHTLQIGALPNSVPADRLPASNFAGTPPKTAHFTAEQIAADLADGQNGQVISPELLDPDHQTPVPTGWALGAIDEELDLFRAAGIARFGFYGLPSRYADEPIYARQFCRGMTRFPCIPAEDPALIAGLGCDEDWLDETHLQGPGRARYTQFLAERLAASRVLP